MEINGLILTEKMTHIYQRVLESLLGLPLDLREFLFGPEYDEDYDWLCRIANYIILEYIKYSFEYNEELHSLRYFFKQKDISESEQKSYERTWQEICENKQEEAKRLGIILPESHKFAKKEMDEIQMKLKGHKVSEMNFLEIKAHKNMELIKLMDDRRIVKNDKIDNSRFRRTFGEYDNFVDELIGQSKLSDADMVFASLAFYILDNHFPIEALYYISCLMEEEGIKEVSKDDLILICNDVKVPETRIFAANNLLTDYLSSENKELYRLIVQESIILGYKYKLGMMLEEDDTNLRDYFKTETTVEDWASFFRAYDIFAIWQKKDFSKNKRIRIMRYLLDNILINKEKS